MIFPRFSHTSVREEEKKIDKELTDSEDNIRALQTIGQCTAEVLKRLDDGRCISYSHFIYLLIYWYIIWLSDYLSDYLSCQLIN